MKSSSLDRRSFLQHSALGAAALLAAPTLARAAGNRALHLSTNAYSWQVFYQREGKNFGADLDAGLKDVAASGLNGFEPGVGGLEEIRKLLPALQKQGLGMRSVYVNSTLHESAEADKSITNILGIARELKPAGTRIIVTNPNPIRWGGPDNKSDAQLRTQAAAMERLGRELAALKLTLAYHNHDIELRNAARELHHMMNGTDPRYVTLCLDAHWMYRGAGNSFVALMDIAKLYGRRVTEMHLRQSRNNVWSETLEEGDIDYPALVAQLAKAGARPHLVMEIAVENGTPKTLSPVEAHRRSVEYARRVFAPLA